MPQRVRTRISPLLLHFHIVQLRPAGRREACFIVNNVHSHSVPVCSYRVAILWMFVVGSSLNVGTQPGYLLYTTLSESTSLLTIMLIVAFIPFLAGEFQRRCLQSHRSSQSVRTRGECFASAICHFPRLYTSV